jgi:hypothetical protein
MRPKRFGTRKKIVLQTHAELAAVELSKVLVGAPNLEGDPVALERTCALTPLQENDVTAKST